MDETYFYSPLFLSLYCFVASSHFFAFYLPLLYNPLHLQSDRRNRVLLVSTGQAIRLVSGSSARTKTDYMMITTVNIQTRVYDYYMISTCSLTSLVSSFFLLHVSRIQCETPRKAFCCFTWSLTFFYLFYLSYIKMMIKQNINGITG